MTSEHFRQFLDRFLVRSENNARKRRFCGTHANGPPEKVTNPLLLRFGELFKKKRFFPNFSKSDVDFHILVFFQSRSSLQPMSKNDFVLHTQIGLQKKLLIRCCSDLESCSRKNIFFQIFRYLTWIFTFWSFSGLDWTSHSSRYMYALLSFSTVSNAFSMFFFLKKLVVCF